MITRIRCGQCRIETEMQLWRFSWDNKVNYCPCCGSDDIHIEWEHEND